MATVGKTVTGVGAQLGTAFGTKLQGNWLQSFFKQWGAVRDVFVRRKKDAKGRVPDGDWLPSRKSNLEGQRSFSGLKTSSDEPTHFGRGKRINQ